MPPERQLTEEQQQKRRKAIAELMPTTPFIKSLGLVFDRYEPDDVTGRVPFRADLTNDCIYYHGGVVASAIDRFLELRTRQLRIKPSLAKLLVWLAVLSAMSAKAKDIQDALKREEMIKRLSEPPKSVFNICRRC